MYGIGRTLIEKSLVFYYCLKDPETPVWLRVLFFGTLGYLILPIDVIPDLFLGVGFLDDLVILIATCRVILGHVKPKHREQARLRMEQKGGRIREDEFRETKNNQRDSCRRNHPRTQDYYAQILGLNGDINLESVKSRYSDLAMKYHPDRVQHLGDEFREMAEQKMKEINEAYQYFKKKYHRL